MTLASVLAVWRAKPGLLLLTSNSLLESGVKLAYWAFSFFYGEAIPVWMLPVTALLAIPVAWLLWTGARAARSWLLPAAVTALIGFAGWPAGFPTRSVRRGCCFCCRWRCSRSRRERIQPARREA